MTDREFESILEKYEEMPGSYSTPREGLAAPKKSWVEQRKWDIPDPFVIKVAPVGAFIMKTEKPIRNTPPRRSRPKLWNR